jgi:hypothetical protein
MIYKVIKDFADLQDGKHIYHAGDTFPRDGVEVSADRIAELASAKNKVGTVLIIGEETAEIDAETEENATSEEAPVKAVKPRRKANKKEN